MCRADMGGKVASLSSPALPEDPNLGACPTPPPPRPFTAHPAVHRAFSLSLSLSARVSLLEACFASRLAASSGGSASHDSPQLPPGPYARSQAQ
jgi:hypothetical protein